MKVLEQLMFRTVCCVSKQTHDVCVISSITCVCHLIHSVHVYTALVLLQIKEETQP